MSKHRFLTFFSGCKPAPTGPQPITDADRQQMKEWLDAWVKGELASDASTLGTLVTDDVIFLPPDAEIVRGKAAVQEFYEALFKEHKVTTLIPDVVGDFGVDGLAYNINHFTLAVEPPSSSFMPRGKAILVLEKGTDGCWKCVAACWNSSPSQPTPPQQ